MQNSAKPSENSAMNGSSNVSHRPSVLLINPPITHAQRTGPLGPIIKNLYFNSPPLGIAYITGLLESKGMRVHLMDAAVEGFSPEETVEKIAAWQPDILGLTSTSNFFCNAIELATPSKPRCLISRPSSVDPTSPARPNRRWNIRVSILPASARANTPPWTWLKLWPTIEIWSQLRASPIAATEPLD